MLKSKRWLTVSILALLVLSLTAGSVLAQDLNHPHPPGPRLNVRFIQVAADTLGMDVEDFAAALRDGQTPAEIAEANGSSGQSLIDAITAAVQAELDALVDAGRITPEQAAQIMARMTPAIERWVNQGPTPRHPDPCRRDFEQEQRWIRISADTLDMAVRNFVAALRDGQTPAEIAEANGSNGQALIDAIIADLQARLDAAVAAGRITQEQADRIMAHMTPIIADWVNEGPQVARLICRLQRRWAPVSADTLGMDVRDFVAALRAGQTPAEIAEANGSSGQGLIDAITADLQTVLDDAVAAGRITQEQADRITALLAPRIENWVNNGPPQPASPGGSLDVQSS